MPSAPSVSGGAGLNGLTGTTATDSALVPAPPMLTSGANYNPKTTEMTVVPLVSSLSSIPPLPPAEISQVQEWMAMDHEYEAREAFSVGVLAVLQWW